jgi:hypothetical protein
MIRNEMKNREISDLALASFLAAKGHSIHSIKPSGKKSLFLFEESDVLEKDILAFYNRKTKIDALTFAEMIRSLKAMALQG